jgi:hypothetical protein
MANRAPLTTFVGGGNGNTYKLRLCRSKESFRAGLNLYGFLPFKPAFQVAFLALWRS